MNWSNKSWFVLCLVAQPCPALCDLMDYSPPCSSVHGDSPGKNIRVGCHALFQGIFPTCGSELSGKPKSGFAAAAKSLQLCLTLCDPIDSSPPGSPIPGILKARTLEWVAISFSNAWKWRVKVKPLSRVRPSATPWTAAFQAPPSMGFSRQEYWSGVPLPSPKVDLGNHNLYRIGYFSRPIFKSAVTEQMTPRIIIHLGNISLKSASWVLTHLHCSWIWLNDYTERSEDKMVKKTYKNLHWRD